MLDGSLGEGGGQILRTSLSLSMCTGVPFRIERIRARRKKPGLLRQHLTAVLASAELCAAEVEGAEIGSQTLTFRPGAVRAGEYRFSTGSAGSCTLVLQTILPALLHAKQSSTVTLEGGTHNPAAPPFPFVGETFAAVLGRMGGKLDVTLNRHGFYPAGGGEIVARITPVEQLAVIELMERGELVGGHAESLVAGLPEHVAKRELGVIGKAMHWSEERLRVRALPREQGPGNAVLITLVHTNVTEIFSAFGERGVAAETVAAEAVDQARTYLASDGAVCAHLADQLLVPMALAGGGRFTASEATPHTRTNAQVIARFLPVKIDISDSGRNAYTVVVRS